MQIGWTLKMSISLRDRQGRLRRFLEIRRVDVLSSKPCEDIVAFGVRYRVAEQGLVALAACDGTRCLECPSHPADQRANYVTEHSYLSCYPQVRIRWTSAK